MQRKSYFLIFIIVLSSLFSSACLPMLLTDKEKGTKKNSASSKSKSKTGKTEKHTTSSSEPVTLEVDKNAQYVNAMGNAMPEMPDFDDLSPEPGKVKGYVKDLNGNPLEGAKLGVRSTAAGGFYSGSQGVTDADGYYEFEVPMGVAHFYNAGYALEWGDGLAAVGLHPADGELDSFASNNGSVENFVLLPYGITSRENVQENPHLPSSYYGGALYIGYWTEEKLDEYTPKTNFLQGSVFEITLTADGAMLAENTPREFTIKKTAGVQSGFYINNIPLGHYKISVTCDGKPVKMKLNKPQNSPFGMKPSETDEEADITFAPSGAKADMATPQYGGWDIVGIQLENQ